MPKRANGEGSIRRRADGRWEAQLCCGKNPATGKVIRKSLYAATQKEVRQKLREALQALDEGTYTAPQKITVREWCEVWLQDYTGNVKPATRIRYEQDIRIHIVPKLGGLKLSVLTVPVIQRFCNDLQRGEHPLSAKSVRNTHGVLHQLLKQAVKVGLIRSNPAEGTTLPRIERHEMMPLDAPDVRKLLDVLGDDTISTIILVDLLTGLRLSEILGLQWSRVDFDNGELYIDRQLTRPRSKGNVYVFSSLKNDKPRTIKPAPFVMQALKEHRRRQLQMRLQAGSLWDDGGLQDLVFTNETGGHLYDDTVRRHYKRILRQAGLEDRRFHDLRHSFAILALQSGVDIKTLQMTLGHHSASFTLDIYAHATSTMREAAAQKMENFVAELR